MSGSVADNVTGGVGALTFSLLDSPNGNYGTLTFNPNGSWSYTLTSPVIGPSANNGTNTVNNAETFSYRVTDANGNTSVNSITIDIIDDVPTATTPIAVNVINQNGGTNAAFLDADNSVANNYGADGPGKLFFTSDAITALEGQSLTSGGQPLNYAISPDGLTLTATKPDASVVFTIQIQPPGFNDQYKVNISQPLDAVTQIDFNADGYDFSGGNVAWNYFRDDATPNSPDILLTPIGASGQTVNTNANSGGVGGGGGGGAIEAGEGLRIDFVTDLLGTPSSGGSGYQNAGNRNHTFSDHYTVNGASAVFASTAGSTVRFEVKDDPDGVVGNDAVGDGTTDAITAVAIRFGASTVTVNASGSPQNVSVGGQNYTVTFTGGIVTISGIVSDTQVAIFTDDGYNSLEVSYVSGSSFRIGDFGASAITTTEPVPFTVPVSIVDADGDVANGAVLSITAVPAAPPVALDLDGDGVEFLSQAAGVAFDYDGDGVAEPTAWVGPDDGLLVHDANGDRVANDGSEIVFAVGASTDLEGVRLRFDTDGDGKLTAADAEFSRFGVWQDANSNGVTDPGEFSTLSELGIASLDLTSDGKSYVSEGGQVLVHGTASFTRTNGTSGALADTSFATAPADRRSADLALVASLAGALAVPEVLAAHDSNPAVPETAANALPSAEVGSLHFAIGTGSEHGNLLNLADLLRHEGVASKADASSSHLPSDAPSSPSNLAADGVAEVATAVPWQSEAGVDFGGLVTGQMGGVSPEAVMDALLLQTSGEAVAVSQDVASVREALAEVSDEVAVNAIVDHFAGDAPADAPAPDAGAGHQLLAQTLDAQVFLMTRGMLADHSIDDAAQLVAAA
ncbi:Ig-like domain-containing protein [Sphingopyxis sp. 113P3]|uniref:Ig-like domain-containing protein n=1 Tax=Sphingopyxis sp. (strain 113P3) TaxID=292913 RepID=UPI0006AD22AC|nr:VCBS domain-containing protein [Sphingopyxis sp. 113P3]ALC11618.1 structural toxin protein RtxA [Sphingopyxis sp. 113P3]